MSRYLDQETASQAVTCYYQSNHSKVEAIPLSALPKDTNFTCAQGHKKPCQKSGKTLLILKMIKFLSKLIYFHFNEINYIKVFLLVFI